MPERDVQPTPRFHKEGAIARPNITGRPDTHDVIRINEKRREIREENWKRALETRKQLEKANPNTWYSWKATF